MSQKEVARVQVLDRLQGGTVRPEEAAALLGVSTRQLRRLVRRYAAEGPPGLISRSRGRPSNRRLPEALRTRAEALIRMHYPDFGPTLAHEKLTEQHGLRLSVEATRQLMIAAGVWQPEAGRPARIQPLRPRRPRFGELIQIDGSPHAWFEERGPVCTLLVFVDDASGSLTQLRLAPLETTRHYFQTLAAHIGLQGLPVALYSDQHSIFRINAKNADPAAETQFARACRELGILCIHARSPQAKGRVERANQTLQDRLVKELRLRGIDTLEQANAWLPQYLADYNRRFAVVPREAGDAHRPWTGTPTALRRILSVQTPKILSKQLSCQHAGQLLQVRPRGTGLGLRGAHITIHDHWDGTQELLWRQRPLAYETLERPRRQAAVADSKALQARVDAAVARRSTGHVPAPDHPWRTPAIAPKPRTPTA